MLSEPILHIETSISPLIYNDNLIYHYAGGCALGALKKWREAEEFFEICASAPGQAAAAIQLEALKKLTLVQLILYGKVQLCIFTYLPTLLLTFHVVQGYSSAEIYPPNLGTVIKELALWQSGKDVSSPLRRITSFCSKEP